MDSTEEDSADTFKGYDPEAGKCVIANGMKRNKPSELWRREVGPVDTKPTRVRCWSEAYSEYGKAT